MNALEQWLADHPERFFSPTSAMNELQGAGLVSDNAAWPADVDDADCPKAVLFLDALN